MDNIVESAEDEMEDGGLYEEASRQAQIRVVGVGGAGNNIVSWLYRKGIRGAEIIACNTDQQHINISEADKKFLIGKDLTKGLGAGGDPKTGEEAARESVQKLKQSLDGSDMVFVCAGMGGGTGTGASSVVAKVAQNTGAIVIGTVTMPFEIERARCDKAEHGLQELRKVTDTVIVIDNNRLSEIAGDLPIQKAFAVANELVSTMIKGIVETIAVPSLVNLDYADVEAIMSNAGVAAIGVGNSDTSNKVEEAVQGALSNPLLDIDYEGATGALIHVTGGPDMTMDEVSKTGDMVTDNLDPDANVIWGARIDEEMEGQMTVMTIVTGVESPWILGERTSGEPSAKAQRISNELGIEMVEAE